jgi:small neutral amino acid transporter SnatA (MarC family)
MSDLRGFLKLHQDFERAQRAATTRRIVSVVVVLAVVVYLLGRWAHLW